MTTSTDTTTAPTSVEVVQQGRKWLVQVAGTTVGTFAKKSEAQAEAAAEREAQAARVASLVDQIETAVATKKSRKAKAALVIAREAPANAAETTAEAPEAPVTPEAPAAPVVDDVTAQLAQLGRLELLAVAKAENLLVREWKAGGQVGARPAPPACDLMANPALRLAAGGRKARAKSTGGTRTTFGTFEVTEGVTEYNCVVCLTTKPVNAFPTVKGPQVRGCRCRACRDKKD